MINKKINPRIVSPDQIIEELTNKSKLVISDPSELEKICDEVIKENAKVVNDYKNGKQTALQALIGAVMKKTSGKADVGKVSEILKKLLDIDSF